MNRNLNPSLNLSVKIQPSMVNGLSFVIKVTIFIIIFEKKGIIAYLSFVSIILITIITMTAMKIQRHALNNCTVYQFAYMAIS